MKRFQQMIQTHDRDHIEIARRLQYTLDCIGQGDMDAAKSEIMEAYRAAKKTEVAFNELALLVGVLLNELQQVNEAETAPSTALPDSLVPPDDSVSMGTESLVTLLKRLHAEEESRL